MSLLTNGLDTVVFLLADPYTDHDDNVVWKVGTETLTITGASVFPIGSSGVVAGSGGGTDEGQTSRATASINCRWFDGDIDRLYYGHVSWGGRIWHFTEKPKFFNRSPGVAHMSAAIREVLRIG